MKLEQTGARQWEATTPMGFVFTFGSERGSSKFFEVVSEKIKLQFDARSYNENVFVRLEKLYQQIKLKAFPYREEDYDFKQLSEGIESLLRSVGLNPYIQEYGDEEEDFEPYKYHVCFENGEFEYREQFTDGRFNVYTLVKYGDLRTLVINREEHTHGGRITGERKHYMNSRQHITAMSPEDAIQCFN